MLSFQKIIPLEPYCSTPPSVPTHTGSKMFSMWVEAFHRAVKYLGVKGNPSTAYHGTIKVTFDVMTNIGTEHVKLTWASRAPSTPRGTLRTKHQSRHRGVCTLIHRKISYDNILRKYEADSSYPSAL